MPSKPSAIVLSIGNVLTERNFFSHGLFPFFLNNVGHFFRTTSHKRTTQQMIAQLRAAQERLLNQNSDSESSTPKPTGIKVITAQEEDSSEDIEQVAGQCAQFASWLAEHSAQSVELKELRLLMWVWAIENRLIIGHVFEEVAECLHQWKHRHRIRTCVYSQAHHLMQQLLLVHTDKGNLISLIECFFDYQWGAKTDHQTYEYIASHLELEPSKVLLISDTLQEANAAVKAGLRAALLKRTGPQMKLPDKRIIVIGALDDLTF